MTEDIAHHVYKLIPHAGDRKVYISGAKNLGDHAKVLPELIISILEVVK